MRLTGPPNQHAAMSRNSGDRVRGGAAPTGGWFVSTRSRDHRSFLTIEVALFSSLAYETFERPRGCIESLTCPGGLSMQTSEVFQNRASECERMAKSTRDASSKATWTRMAERWHHCTEVAMRASLAAAHHSNEAHHGDRHRQPAPGWSRHH